MANYDINLNTRPDLMDSELEDIQADICRVITQHEGTIYRKGISGQVGLTQSLKGHQKARQIFINFAVAASRVHEIEAAFPVNEDILQVYFVSLDDVADGRKY